MEKEHILYGKNSINFYIERKSVKNINLTVTPECKIIVSANEEISIEYLKKFILKKARWINRNVKYFEKNKFMKKEFNNI